LLFSAKGKPFCVGKGKKRRLWRVSATILAWGKKRENSFGQHKERDKEKGTTSPRERNSDVLTLRKATLTHFTLCGGRRKITKRRKISKKRIPTTE